MIPRSADPSPFEIEVGGTPLGRFVLFADVFLAADRPDRLEAELEDGVGRAGWRAALRPGAPVRARIAGAEVFEGSLDRAALRADPGSCVRIGVVAYAAYHYRRREAARGAYRHATDSEIAESIAAALRLQAVVEPTAPALDRVVLEGDPLSHLRRRAREIGFELAVAREALYFSREVPAERTVAIAASRLFSADLEDLGRDRGGRGGSLELAGDPDLRPLAAVLLRGAHRAADGTYRVVRAVHRLRPGGYRTAVQVLEEGLDYERWRRGEAGRAGDLSRAGGSAHG